MTSDEPPSGKARASLLRVLTGARARIFASIGVGLLAWADAVSVKVPFYLLGKAALVAREAAAFVAAEAAQAIPDVIEQIEQNRFSVAGAARTGVAIAVVYLGYRFFRRVWQALAKIYPTNWEFWPRVGWRRKLILAALLAAGAAAAWQFGAFPWIGAQIAAFGRRTFGQLSWQGLSDSGRWLWRTSVAVYENKETVLPAVKGVLAGLATYATLEVARVLADLLWPAVRIGRAVCGRARPWSPDVRLSRRQKDWLHGAGSVTGGLIFGFSEVSVPSVPSWMWAALAPGLFLFARERPNLVSEVSRGCLHLARCLRRGAEFTYARPGWTGGIAAGIVVGIAAAGALLASHPLLGFAIILGIMKAAYAGTVIALLIAAGRGSAALAGLARRIIGQRAARPFVAPACSFPQERRAAPPLPKHAGPAI